MKSNKTPNKEVTANVKSNPSNEKAETAQSKSKNPTPSNENTKSSSDTKPEKKRWNWLWKKIVDESRSKQSNVKEIKPEDKEPAMQKPNGENFNNGTKSEKATGVVDPEMV